METFYYIVITATVAGLISGLVSYVCGFQNGYLKAVEDRMESDELDEIFKNQRN